MDRIFIENASFFIDLYKITWINKTCNQSKTILRQIYVFGVYTKLYSKYLRFKWRYNKRRQILSLHFIFNHKLRHQLQSCLHCKSRLFNNKMNILTSRFIYFLRISFSKGYNNERRKQRIHCQRHVNNSQTQTSTTV